MKFWTKLFSRCGVLSLIASPISVNSQIITTLKVHQEAESRTKIAHGVDSTPRSVDFRTFPSYIGFYHLLHQINRFLKIEKS